MLAAATPQVQDETDARRWRTWLRWPLLLAALAVGCSFLVLPLPTLPAALSTLSPLLLAILCAVGAFHVALFLFRNGRFAYTQFLRPPLDLAARYGAGSWAVVTGASGGIGLGFAVELAKRGFNICLIARDADRLEAAAQEVRVARAGACTHCIVTDFRFCSSVQYWEDLHKQFSDLDVSVLVNNVGINHTEHFTAVPPQFLLDAVAVNCTTQVMMSRLVVNAMLARPARRSAIISLSSVAGMRPLLYLAPYSATKAFNDFFSRALALEYPNKIDVLSLRPGYVVSNMSKLTEKGGFVLDRYECARGCLDKLGYVTETYGDPRHSLYARSYFSLPEEVLSARRRQRLEEKRKL